MTVEAMLCVSTAASTVPLNYGKAHVGAGIARVRNANALQSSARRYLQ